MILTITGVVIAQPPVPDEGRDVHPEVRAAFASRDADGDGSLTEAEFAAGGGPPAERLARDFRAFDADGDGRLGPGEFAGMPLWPEGHRGPVPDPVELLARAKADELAGLWGGWDRDGDGRLDFAEFAAATPGNRISGLEQTAASDWDLDRDGLVAADEAGQFIDVAFGVRVATGEPLRSGGRVLDWRMFRGLDADGDGKVPRDDYLAAARPPVADPPGWFRSLDADADERFDVAEFGKTYHRTDPAAEFLGLDTDLDARLSPGELEALSPDRRPLARYLVAGFDDDGDGGLSLREYQLTPVVNLLANWHVAADADGDGRLSAAEFRFAEPPALAALAAEYFRRLDTDGDGALGPEEWAFASSHPGHAFASYDADGDGGLSAAEFAAGLGWPADRSARDFRVFDADGDGRLSPDEFAAVPHAGPEDRRGPIPDPIESLARAKAEELAGLWGGWDWDSDGGLSGAEFAAATPGRRVPGLELIGLADWDLDRDGAVTRAEAVRLIEVAYGVRVPTGEPLRSGGRVLDWRMFRQLDADGDGEIPRSDYMAAAAPAVDDLDDWFRWLDTDADGRFDLTELARSHHRTDPAASFLDLDSNLDGRLTRDELERVSPDLRSQAARVLPGFDDDGDGGLSLREYQLTPMVNLLTHWHMAADTDHDGRLSPAEFRFAEPPALAALAAEYFRRLDTDGDGGLGPKEWVFVIDPARGPAEVVFGQKDADGDGRLTFEELRGDLPRPKPGEPVDLAREQALMVAEEAFRRADADGDGTLDLPEFAADAGREAAVPGSTALSNKIDAAAAVLGPGASGGASARTYAVLAFDGLLVLGVAAYLFRKSRRPR